MRKYLKATVQRQNSSPQYWAIRVPAAIPSKPRPCQPPSPKLSRMLEAMFTTLIIRSVHIELIESCIPTNQPLKAISEMVAGAAHILMRKYLAASSSTSSEALVTAPTSLRKGLWISRHTRATAALIHRARRSI